MEKLIIIGAGGHSSVLIGILKKKGYEIVGYIDNSNFGAVSGITYLGNDDDLHLLYEKGIKNAVLGIGQIEVTQKRYEIIQKIKSIGYCFPTIISTNAIVNDYVKIGEGTQILDGAILNSGTKVGEFTIINTNSTVEHDCRIGNYCHIATGAVLCGGVEVGNFSIIGANAVIVQYKTISEQCLIGAGSVVIKDIKLSGVYAGNPVRRIK